MNSDLSRLLEELSVGSLHSHYQPVVDLRAREVVACEALLRPVLHDGSLLAPALLFAEARKNNCLAHLEEASRDAALRGFQAAEGTLAPHVMLFINYSPHLLDNRDLSRHGILRSVQDAGIPAQRIAVEISESTVETTVELQAFVALCRESGFLIILDDFGTEHSSLHRVALLEPDIIKIDRSIIHEVSTDRFRRSVLQSTVQLAQTMGAISLAEGIENPDDLVVCLEAGVQLGQGFLLGRPAPALQHMQDKVTQMFSRSPGIPQNENTSRQVAQSLEELLKRTAPNDVPGTIHELLGAAGTPFQVTVWRDGMAPQRISAAGAREGDHRPRDSHPLMMRFAQYRNSEPVAITVPADDHQWYILVEAAVPRTAVLKVKGRIPLHFENTP